MNQRLNLMFHFILGGSFFADNTFKPCTIWCAITSRWNDWQGMYVFITRSQFWPSCIVVACVNLSVCASITCTITRHPFKLGLSNLDHRCNKPWLRSLFFKGDWIDYDFQGQIEIQSQIYPIFELTIELQFQNLEQKCILALFRPLLILGLIEIDLQFNFQFQTQTKLSYLCKSLAFFSETS